MDPRPVSATVYIEYLKGTHASMYIGDINSFDVGHLVDTHYIDDDGNQKIQKTRTTLSTLSKDDYGNFTNRGVDFRPGGHIKSFIKKPIIADTNWRQLDHDIELKCDVLYDLYDLDVNKMLGEHKSAQDNYYYKLLTNNCSTVVANILIAGGVREHLNENEFNFDGWGIWTPRKVAELCNKLAEKNFATKVKHKHCPNRWTNPLEVLLGRR
ncbi:hypothetical protein [Xenorhabdus innexi]|uniref:RTX toxin n=1 Tax=Xenorhabdus innexi TaxID=290109 RepID=A0A1N6MXD2_9GAMM|nr:hypothetical protein [Xenorhabdus innexi]PHM30347.1 RTX toxin [Xenorhabdus innexi]SIP73427.1 hypothetical protein XIS1_210011 [Xenorhabdus innexi]